MSKQYCFVLGVDEFSVKDLVGLKALRSQQLLKLNVPMPQAIVISGKAFDDYILENNLVEPIVNTLEAVGTGKFSAETAEEKIQQLLNTGSFPRKFAAELAETYRNLSEGFDSLVALSPSNLSAEIMPEKQDIFSTKLILSKGMSDLQDKIRAMWGSLFDSEAISFRLKNDYEGSLSQPIFISKFYNAELSGTVYNFDLETKSTTKNTIVSRLGFLAPEDETPVVDDYYCVEKISSKVVTKVVEPQKFMWIKPTLDASTIFSQVKVSKLWGERDRLTPEQANEIFRIVNAAENALQKRFALQWVFMGGKFIVHEVIEVSDSAISKLKPFSWPKPESESLIKITQEAMPEKLPESKPIEPVPTPEKAAENKKDKEELLQFIGKQETEIALPPDLREKKAETVRQMIPEVKTITEVWHGKDVSTSELRVFANNLDGVGIFKIAELVQMFAEGDVEASLANSQKLQKQICEYLALYAIALSPKPILIQLENSFKLEPQINLLSQFKNMYGHKNFWCVLPELRTIEDISFYKKQLSASGFRRTNAFKIFQSISQPLFLRSIQSLIDQSIDGIIVDADKLYLATLAESGQKDDSTRSRIEQDLVKESDNLELFFDYLFADLLTKSKLKLYTVFKTDSQLVLDKYLPQLLDVSIHGIFYSGNSLYDFKYSLADQEAQILTKSLKKIKKKLNSL